MSIMRFNPTCAAIRVWGKINCHSTAASGKEKVCGNQDSQQVS